MAIENSYPSSHTGPVVNQTITNWKDKTPSEYYDKSEVNSSLGLKENIINNDAKLALKVDKIVNKGLSEAEYTNIEKSKLLGIASGSEVNVIQAISVDGLNKTPDSNRAVNIDLSGKADYSKTITAYDITLEYTLNSFCYYEGKIYKSLQNGNIGNNPITAVIFWKEAYYSNEYLDGVLGDISALLDTINGEVV